MLAGLLALGLGPASIAGTTDDLVYLHGSCGEAWLAHSLHDALVAKSTIDERNDIGSGADLPPDAGRPDSLAPTPGDNTAVRHWLLWFNDYLAGIQAHGSADGVNRIIMFGSDFTACDITADGTEPGDPFSAERALTNYKAVFHHPDGAGNTYTHDGHTYRPLDDVFAANPDTLFIVVTPPPLCSSSTTWEEAGRAYAFSHWLKGEWLAGYRAAHPALDNVAVFDWFGLLANEDHMLKAEYGGDTGESQPNDAGNAASTEAFAAGTPNFLDVAWRAFTTDEPITIYVDDDNTGGIEDGTAAYPFNTIQEGIDAAVHGDTVLVADGIYQGDGNRDLDFCGKAITVTSERGPERCIIDCNASYHGERHRGFYFHTVEGPDSVLEGITITRGWKQPGGGIPCYGAAPTIAGCILRHNFGNFLGVGNDCVLLWGDGNIDADPCFAAPGQWDAHGTTGGGTHPLNDTWTSGDVHLRSPAGRFDPATGLWVTTDVETSPCIDAGDPAAPVGDEPSPNGSRINMGAYGGTTQASKTPDPVADYYVNDTETLHDQYCTAPGEPANDGRSPAAPKASIRDVLDTYDLGPGDTIWVDTGVYALAQGIVIGAADEGAEGVRLRIIGSPHPDGSVLDGSMLTTAVTLDDCRHVSIEQLQVAGADTGIAITAPTAAPRYCMIHGCAVTANRADGIYVRRAGGCLLRDNLVAANGANGIYCDEAHDIDLTHNIVRHNQAFGLGLAGCDRAAVEANTVAANDEDQIDVLHTDTGPVPATLAHNILYAEQPGTHALSRRLEAVLDSNYNDLYATNGALVGYHGADCPTLADWQAASGQDAASIAADPLFADLATGDVHLQSTEGRYHPTSAAWVTDAQISPCIDAGAPTASFTTEPAPNGFWRNLGGYGDTAEASKSPSPPQAIAVTSPNGGEVWTGNQLITWRAIGAGWGPHDNVTIEYSPDLGGTWKAVLSPGGVAASALGYGRGRVGYIWDTAGAEPNCGDTFLIRVTGDQNPALTDQSDAPFTLVTLGPPGPPVFDTRVLVGDLLNPAGPGPRSMTIESIDPNGNPPAALYAVRLGSNPDSGWLVLAGDSAFPVGAEPEGHSADAWRGVRVRSLLPGTLHTFYAIAMFGHLTSPESAGTCVTNDDCDVDGSGFVSAFDYALIKTCIIHGVFKWPCDVDDSGALDATDLGLTLDRFHNR